MARDAAATRSRILGAAIAEFAEHGLAGARVDRIAERAEANKQLLYAHFGNKEALFDATLIDSLHALLDAVPFDATDLPGYAVAMFDFTLDRPEIVRLAQWHTLERPGVLTQLPEAVASTVAKLDALAAAQERGEVDATLPAPQLLTTILAIAQGGMVDEGLSADPTPAELDARRAAIAHAVGRLTAPT
jgi:AcrR family transcriptional regulator